MPVSKERKKEENRIQSFIDEKRKKKIKIEPFVKQSAITLESLRLRSKVYELTGTG